MSRKQYPQRGYIRRKPSGRPCACCGAKDEAAVCIEWSYMRGDDEDHPVCGVHRDMARTDFKTFVRVIRDRARSLTPS